MFEGSPFPGARIHALVLSVVFVTPASTMRNRAEGVSSAASVLWFAWSQMEMKDEPFPEMLM